MVYGCLRSWRGVQFVHLFLWEFVVVGSPPPCAEALFNFYFPLFFFFFLFFHPQNSVAVASIHLPLAGTPFSSSALQSVDNSTCRLQFIVFRNGKLFPCTGNSSNLADDGKRRSVSTPVAFTKLGKRKSIFIAMPVMSTPRRIANTCFHTHTESVLRNTLKRARRSFFVRKDKPYAHCFMSLNEVTHACSSHRRIPYPRLKLLFFLPGSEILTLHINANAHACVCVVRTGLLCVYVSACVSCATALAHFPHAFFFSPHCLNLLLLLQMGAASGAPCTPSLSLSGTSRWV